MNPLKKIYCRTFQTGLKIALPFLPYRKPKIVGSVKALPEVIQKKKCSKVLIITDAGIRKLGLTRRLEKALENAGIPFCIYDKTVANPTTDNVSEAVDIYMKEGCDCIIGFGGGSSMDCAKAAGACIVKPKQSLAKMKGILKVHKRLPLLMAVPTTAGTGSETTLAAVITDALTHAVEAYIGNSTTYGTRKDALLAVKLIFENIDTAYEDGSNVEARRNMLHASFYAGCAFTKSYVGYVHAIAHSLGGEYNVPHGLANVVILPMMLEAYGEKIYRKLSRLAVAAGLADETTPCDEAARQFIQAIKDMKKRFGIGDKIPEIQETDIPKLAHYADKEANPLYPVPVLMDASELETYYHMLMDEDLETEDGPKDSRDISDDISEEGETKHDGTGN